MNCSPRNRAAFEQADPVLARSGSGCTGRFARCAISTAWRLIRQVVTAGCGWGRSCCRLSAWTGATVAFVACWVAGLASLHADYTVTLVSDGLSERSVQLGDAFSVDVMLASDAADKHTSANLRVVFSSPGLIYEGYEWSPPFEMAGPDEVSQPGASALPLRLSEDTLAGPGLDEEATDIFLSNVVAPPSAFGEGRIARLHLRLPSGFRGPSVLWLRVEPDSFSDGFVLVAAKGAAAFVLRILPSPELDEPLLQVREEQGEIVISWPDGIGRGVLEVSEDPTQPDHWVPVLEAAKVVEGKLVTRVSAGAYGHSAFFRLSFR